VAALASTTSTVTVLDTADNSIDTTITADGMSLSQLAITPNGRKLLAINVRGFPNPPDSTVAVIDTRDNTLTTAAITVGRVPFAIATQPSPRDRKDRDHDADDRRDQNKRHRDRDDDHDDRDNDRDHTR
jgi:DNA-binding beta-propeller fold protein YncE